MKKGEQQKNLSDLRLSFPENCGAMSSSTQKQDNVIYFCHERKRRRKKIYFLNTQIIFFLRKVGIFAETILNLG